MRLVLLAFEDNDTADAFVKAVESDNILYATPAVVMNPDHAYPEVQWESLENVRAAAMWQAPTKLCECHPPWQRPNDLEKKASGLTCFSGRSKKYGWVLCTKCMKPHGFSVIHPKNLLVEVEDLKDREFVLGFRADRTGKREDGK